ncbi:hypothetical protein BIV25_28920 [Streptomyces sp. MUSC 14]|nr:hypothetical protein BIV25_28920 [Streptomyces sp. MUSC 14]
MVWAAPSSSETPKVVKSFTPRVTASSVLLGGSAGQIGLKLKRAAGPALTQSFLTTDAALLSAADAADAAVRL